MILLHPSADRSGFAETGRRGDQNKPDSGLHSLLNCLAEAGALDELGLQGWN